MRSALPYNNACNWRAAFRARRAGFGISAECVLEFTAAVNPIDAGSIGANAFLQYQTQSRQQPVCLLKGQISRILQRMDLRQVKSLIRVNIAHACQKTLIQQQGLDLTAAFL